MRTSTCLIATLLLLCISCTPETRSSGHGGPIEAVKASKAAKSSGFAIRAGFSKNENKSETVSVKNEPSSNHEERLAKWYLENPDYAPKKYRGEKVPASNIPKNKKYFEIDGWALTSWYGPGFHGNPMAWGETFDMTDPTIVAHKTLPRGTKLRLTNPSTGKSIEVRVADHGPYKGKRELDLSWAAAEELGMVDQGVAWLKVEMLS